MFGLPNVKSNSERAQKVYQSGFIFCLHNFEKLLKNP